MRFYERAFDNMGHYDVLIANSDDELLAQALGGRTDCDYGVINVLGKLGYRDKQFTYGTISDEHNLWHTPLESGRPTYTITPGKPDFSRNAHYIFEKYGISFEEYKKRLSE